MCQAIILNFQSSSEEQKGRRATCTSSRSGGAVKVPSVYSRFAPVNVRGVTTIAIHAHAYTTSTTPTKLNANGSTHRIAVLVLHIIFTVHIWLNSTFTHKQLKIQPGKSDRPQNIYTRKIPSQ